MKKIFTLLWLTLAAFSFKATAQTTPNCNAEFGVQYLTNFTVKFNPVVANDSPLVHHYWSFGDGTQGSQLISPTHTYALPGSYPVVHTIVRLNQNNVPVCTQSFTKIVTINEPCNLVVNFSWSSVASNPLTLAFQNLSVPLAATDSVTWQFGDNTSSHAVNPVHTYANAGTYNVCLIVKKNNNNTTAPCIRYICKTVVIQAPCNLVANFSWAVTPTNPLRIEFTNLSVPLSNTDSIKWTFGDGTTSSAVNPVHIYNVPGTYTVCLRVQKFTPPGSAPCVREICKTILVTPPCNIVPNFTWTVTPTNPLRIEFNNTSTNIAATDSIKWTFGDGTFSNQFNPVHFYTAPGTYTVCLKIIRYYSNTTTPCIREICKTIVVQAPCTLVVNFTSQPDSAHPLRIKFTNTSTPINITDSVRWTFGDGSSVSGLQSDPNVANPTHIYANAGSYTVCLRVKKNGNVGSTVQCVREYCRTITVYEPCTLVVNFTSQADPNNPLRIKFTNTSVPVSPTDSLRWSFGDGTSLNGVQSDPNVASPIHNYAHAGNYNVCLIVIKRNTLNNVPCVRYSCRNLVVSEPCNLVVNFTSQPDPNHPLRIKFTNTSTPINPTDSVRWTFGDGSSVSGLQSNPNVANPTHIYANAGTYTVCLRVKKNNSATTPNQVTCVREKCNTVVVTAPCNFTVNFNWRLDSINLRKVYFTNLSTPPAANAIALWNFGDGNSLTSWNAVHEYAQPGRYLVCLRVYLPNSNCVRETCDTVYIPAPVPPCTQLSKYTYQVFPNDNQKYKFTPDYINNTFQYTWTFGDGTGSQDPIAVHRYAQPGVYVACLTVWRGPNCASTTCKEIRVLPQINCDTAHIGYTFVRNSNLPNKFQFIANATLPILDQVWYIYKLNGTVATPPVILHQNNPIYLFQDTGYYKVCLKATLQGGCVKEYCNYIRIDQVSNVCELQAFPNPAASIVSVNLFLTQPEMIYATVYNNLNVVVLQQNQQGNTGNNVVTLQVNNLIAGQYNIRLVYGNRVCYARFQKL
ncbi:MAG: PKD domain-containing protein [Chitinophagaceae bacterium]|nr:PKD domain-containing protein [Chitinophagaceae bacterium]